MAAHVVHISSVKRDGRRWLVRGLDLLWLGMRLKDEVGILMVESLCKVANKDTHGHLCGSKKLVSPGIIKKRLDYEGQDRYGRGRNQPQTLVAGPVYLECLVFSSSLPSGFQRIKPGPDQISI